VEGALDFGSLSEHQRPVRVAFFGNTRTSTTVLEYLARRSSDARDRVQLVAVVSPRKFPSRRARHSFDVRRALDPLLVKRGWRALDGLTVSSTTTVLAQRAGSAVLWPRSLGAPDTIRFVQDARPDLGIVFGFDRIFGRDAIDALPPLFNIHASMLPANRGADPMFWLLAGGATEGGVSIHRIDAGIDTGAVVSQQVVPIEPWFDRHALLDACSKSGIQLLGDLLDRFPDVPLVTTPASAPSYNPLPTAADRAVPCDGPALGALNRSRAVGWTSPLTIVVPRRAWDRREGAVCVSDGTADSVTIALRHPLVMDDVDRGDPGTVLPTVGGGAVVSCNPGAVFFQLAEPLG
jgi:methionyl-tRNA formyltransferase